MKNKHNTMNKAIGELLKRPIAFQPIVAKAVESIPLAILWSQLYYWSDKTTDPDGWIYKTIYEITDETSLTRKQQALAKKLGQALGILEIKRCGKLGVNHYRVDAEKTAELVEIYLAKQESKPTKGQQALIKIEKRKKTIEVQTLEQQIEPFKNKYAPAMIIKFTEYWTEKNARGKERWQMEKTWEIERRLKKWKRQDEEWDYQRSQRNAIKHVDEKPINREGPVERVEGAFQGIGGILQKYNNPI